MAYTPKRNSKQNFNNMKKAPFKLRSQGSCFKMMGSSPVKKENIKPVVSQNRTTADAFLVSSASALGKSYVPGAIDYGINIREVEFEDNESSGSDTTPEEQYFRDRGENAKNNQLSEEEFFGGQKERQKKKDKKNKKRSKKNIT